MTVDDAEEFLVRLKRARRAFMRECPGARITELAVPPQVMAAFDQLLAERDLPGEDDTAFLGPVKFCGIPVKVNARRPRT